LFQQNTDFERKSKEGFKIGLTLFIKVITLGFMIVSIFQIIDIGLTRDFPINDNLTLIFIAATCVGTCYIAYWFSKFIIYRIQQWLD